MDQEFFSRTINHIAFLILMGCMMPAVQAQICSADSNYYNLAYKAIIDDSGIDKNGIVVSPFVEDFGYLPYLSDELKKYDISIYQKYWGKTISTQFVESYYSVQLNNWFETADTENTKYILFWAEVKDNRLIMAMLFPFPTFSGEHSMQFKDYRFCEGKTYLFAIEKEMLLKLLSTTIIID